MDSQMATLEPRVISFEDFLALQTVSNSVEQRTIFQSFVRMAQECNIWLRSNPRKISFNHFASYANYKKNEYNKHLYSFMFLRNDDDILQLWRDNQDRVTVNNFLRITYPGVTKEERTYWKREHLRQLLLLPPGIIIQTKEKASRLIKQLSEGVIRNYSQADEYIKVKLQQDQLPTYVRSVCLNHLQSIIPEEYELETFSIICTTKRKREMYE